MANAARSPFATRLQQLRRQAKMKQEEVALRLSIHRTAYTKYETDRAMPDYDGLCKLAELYGVSTDYLLLGEDQTDSPSQVVRDDNGAVIVLNPQELSLLSAFRQLPQERRKQLVRDCQNEARDKKKP